MASRVTSSGNLIDGSFKSQYNFPLPFWDPMIEKGMSLHTHPKFSSYLTLLVLLWWLSGERIHLQSKRQRRLGFDPWVKKIPWRRKWQPHSSILAWKIPWAEEPGGLQSKGLQRVRHDWAQAWTELYWEILRCSCFHFILSLLQNNPLTQGI